MWILRTFETRDVKPLLTFYKELVLSQIEYCIQLWYPTNKTELLKLEGLKRSFTNRIAYIQHLNYWNRLRNLRINSIQKEPRGI